MLTAILLLGLLVAPELRQRAEEVATAFRAGEVADRRPIAAKLHRGVAQ
jgi:hypothetical protein